MSYTALGMSIIELRRTRKLIRRLVNLVGDGKKIREWPGTWWRADLEQRRVEWTPLWPIAPYRPIDALGLRYLVAHEASHIKWSSLYETKTIPDEHKMRFHRFVNAIEDLRVDRLSEIQFGGFHKAKVHVRKKLRAGHGNHPQGWALWDAVGLNAIYAFDIGLAPEGTETAIEASTRLWPRLNRIANSRSTQEVATALEPIFLELLKIQEQEEAESEEGDEEEGDDQGQGGGSPGGNSAGSTEATESGSEEVEGGVAGGDSTGSETQDGDEEQDSGGGSARSHTKGDSPDEESADDSGGGSEDEEAEADEGDEDEGAGGSDAGDEDGDQEGADEGDGSGGGEQDEQDGDDTEDGGDDPLSGLDDLPDDAGADEPTDAPVKNHGGDKDTAPLAIGEDLEGMAEDATETDAQLELDRLCRGHLNEKQQMQDHVDMQLGKRFPSTPAGAYAYAERKREWKGKINVLTQRLKTVLRHNAMTHPMPGQRRGRFDPGKAYRLQTGDVKVFLKPGQVGGLDYCFGIGIDTSGSMWGGYGNTEIEGAFDACVLIAESLEAAGLPFFLIFWDEDLTHFKPIAEPLRDHEGAIGAVCGAWGGGSSTIEAPAIGLALDEFQKHPHGNRLWINITDGGTSTVEQSKELLGELDAQGVAACTIRIGDEPAEHYERGYSVDHADELTRLLPQLINEVVRRV